MIQSLYSIYESLSSGFLSRVFYWITSPISVLVEENIPTDTFWSNLLNKITTIVTESIFKDTSILELVFGAALAILVTLLFVRFLISIFT